jgi:hypothetical protein
MNVYNPSICEDCEFEVSLGYILRHSLNKKRKKISIYCGLNVKYPPTDHVLKAWLPAYDAIGKWDLTGGSRPLHACP